MHASWHYDETDKVYFIRLHAPDGSFTPVCSCESMAEAKLLCQCLNAVAGTDAHLCMMANRAMHAHLGVMVGNPSADIPADIHKHG